MSNSHEYSLYLCEICMLGISLSWLGLYVWEIVNTMSQNFCPIFFSDFTTTIIHSFAYNHIPADMTQIGNEIDGVYSEGINDAVSQVSAASTLS